ncbi:hypothetical protein [Flavisphingomonas formosensis]|uniref:hypothetical protein n=1 Tax=Flavisphingomonas formosensis TaxID=861534 RepID=UPI0012F8171A|nr:hypothetical protein [Sphingomonas formosensis]
MPIRTILQTLDSSRFQNDRPLDRSVDTAHARSETLIALLFGYDIIVPANDLADSPAFQSLISEIHLGARQPLETYRKINGVPLQLFKVGLEDQYRRRNGFRGYSAFVDAYRSSVLKEKQEGLPPRELVQISESADAGSSSTDMIKGMAAVYLGDDEAAAKALEKSNPRIFQFTQMMRSYFEPRVNTAVEFVYLETNMLSQDYSLIFSRYISMALDRAMRRGANDEKIQSIRSSLEEFMNSDLPKSRRSHWMRRRDIFREHADIIRDWMDFCVYGMLFNAFDARISSYFTQECSFDKEANDIRMGALSNRAFSVYRDASHSSLLPQADRIAWDEIVTLITSKPMADAVRRFHVNIAAAKALNGERREIALEDAKNRHIDFLRNHEKGIYVERYLDGADQERIEIRAHMPTSERWAEKIKFGLRTAASFASIKLKPHMGGASDLTSPALKEMTDRIVGPIGKAVDYLLRPSQISIEEGKAMVSSEMERLNFWIR